MQNSDSAYIVIL